MKTKLKLSEIANSYAHVKIFSDIRCCGTSLHLMFLYSWWDRSTVFDSSDKEFELKSDFLMNYVENDVYPSGLNYVGFIQQDDDDEVTRRITLPAANAPWFDVSQEEIDEIFGDGPTAPRCECGAEKAKTAHALWCPKWERF